MLSQALHEQMAASVQEISNLIDPVAIAARSDASQLGHKVEFRMQTLELYTPPVSLLITLVLFLLLITKVSV